MIIGKMERQRAHIRKDGVPATQLCGQASHSGPTERIQNRVTWPSMLFYQADNLLNGNFRRIRMGRVKYGALPIFALT
jgi:hypothetical protein